MPPVTCTPTEKSKCFINCILLMFPYWSRPDKYIDLCMKYGDGAYSMIFSMEKDSKRLIEFLLERKELVTPKLVAELGSFLPELNCPPTCIDPVALYPGTHSVVTVGDAVTVKKLNIAKLHINELAAELVPIIFGIKSEYIVNVESASIKNCEIVMETVHQASTKFTVNHIYQLAEAVLVIHNAGFAHNDVSPQNVIIDNNNTVKLIDFGSVSPLYQDSDIKQFCKTVICLFGGSETLFMDDDSIDIFTKKLIITHC